MEDNTEESHNSSCDSISVEINISNETDTATSPVYSSLINKVQFYIHPQETITKTLIPNLYKHLPYSNPIFSRMLSPHNTPSRHSLFAATFPPFAQVPSLYTVVFSDRSRKTESQIWIFNPLITPFYSQPLSQEHNSLLTSHLKSLLIFLKATVIPDAPGHPFNPILRFACLHETITNCLTALLSSPSSLIPYHTRWNLYLIPTIHSPISSHLSESVDEGTIDIEKSPRITSENDNNPKGQVNSSIPFGIEQSSLPDDLLQSFTISRVPPEHINLVVSTSSIPREASTLLAQPSLCFLTSSSEMVAWAFIGIDGTLATLYVLPSHRGQGLATHIARELVLRLGRGDFRDLGFSGESGWVHSDVKEGNRGSEGVMKGLGGKKSWVSSYLWVDCGELDDRWMDER